jgi:hypothetical protein
MLPHDVKDAARLVEWGLHPRALPEAHPEYRDLIRRWMDDGGFKTLVASVAEGLKLRVVGVSLRTGIVLGTEAESVFAYTISRFRRHVSNEDAAVVALVLIAACATFIRRRTRSTATRSRRQAPPSPKSAIDLQSYAKC